MARWSSGRAHRSEPLRGLHSSILLLAHFSSAQAPHSRGEARRPHRAAPLGWCWPADGKPSHRATMHTGELNVELVWPHARHPRFRLSVGKPLVVTSPPASSLAVRTAQSALPSPVCLLSCSRVHCTGCIQHFQRLQLNGCTAPGASAFTRQHAHTAASALAGSMHAAPAGSTVAHVAATTAYF
jgi:hypothetical protein